MGLGAPAEAGGFGVFAAGTGLGGGLGAVVTARDFLVVEVARLSGVQ
jgi:hypothetical protein